MRAGVLRDGAALSAGRTAVDAVVWRTEGTLRVTVIAKVTFSFAADAAMERIDAQPVFRDEVHHGQSPARSIRFSVDRVPYLNRGEVLFTGHAYAIAGTAIGMMPVRLGVFDGARALLDKTLLVRHKPGVESLPLVYERAFGGPGWADNPYGVGAVAGSVEADVIALEGAKHLAGFAPIGEAWTARKRRLGTTPRQALEGAVVEIPPGFDWTYFQSAPADQWTDFLRGDEWIVMDGLHPALARVRMRLPGARGMARVYGLSAVGVAEGQPLALHADVLRIDGDEQRCSLTFRGVFPIADEAALAALHVVAGVETPGEPIAWPDPATLFGGLGAADEDGAMTLSDEDLEPVPEAMFEGTLALGEGTAPALARRAVVPFRGGLAAESIAHGTSAPSSREPSLLTVDLSGDGPAPAPLPFHAPVNPAPAPPALVPPPTVVLPYGEDPPPPTVVLAYDAEPATLPPPPPERVPTPASISTSEPPIPPAEPVAMAPAAPPPVPAPTPVVEAPRASPWAPAPEAPPPAPPVPRPPPPQMQAPPSEALKKGLYGRFGGR